MFGDYENFIDMINGGGAGRAGQRFEGGGLLSMIANQVARPYGYQDRLSQARPQARPSMPAPTPAPVNPPITPMMAAEDRVMSMPVRQSMAPMIAAEDQLMSMPVRPRQYSGRGTVGMPMPQFARTPQEQEIIEYLRSIGAINY